MNTRQLSAGGASLTLHVVAALVIAWLPWGDAPLSTTRLTPGPAVVLAEPYGEPPAGAGAPRVADAPAIPTDFGTAFDVPSAEPGGATTFEIDYGKVAERSRSLFPFLTRPLWLERVNPGARGTDAAGSLAVSLAPPRRAERRPPLVLDDAALQAAVDDAWSRRNRWVAFVPIAALVERHPPDDPRLAALLRAYVDQNLLQPYVDTTMRDPRLWSMLAVAADNLDFLRFIERHAAQHQGSETATELLFLLDELAQGNLDGLATLLETSTERELLWTRQASPRAFEVIVETQRYYVDLLRRRGLTSPAAVRAHYDGVRLAILGAILRSSPAGYRWNDAHYLIGTIHWRHGRLADAVAEWRAIQPDTGDSYFTAYSDIHRVLSDPADPVFDRVAATRIDGVLAAEHQRWLRVSTDRLRQFGYRADGF